MGKTKKKTYSRSERKRRVNPEVILAIVSFILAVIVCASGFLEVRHHNETVKNCTSVVMGSVESEGTGILWGMKGTVQGRYLSTGKSARYWIKITVRTDGVFTTTPLYAGSGYGTEGDRLEIHYNPADPDDYYIGSHVKDIFQAAVVLFSVSGIFLAMAVFLVIHHNLKKRSQDEVNEKAAKKAKAAPAKKEKLTPRQKFEKRAEVYTKNYSNPFIRRQILEDCVMFMFVIAMFLVGCFLILLSIGRTINDINTDHEVPFNNYYWHVSDCFYSVEVTRKPEKVYGSYYDLTVGNEHILACNFDIGMDFENDVPVKLRGKLKRVKESNENARKSIKEYYQKTGYLESLKDEEYIFYYLDGTRPDLWKELKNDHPLGLIFGLTILVALAIVLYNDNTLYTIKHISAACSGKRRSAKEIDNLANHKDTLWLDDIEVFVTPEALIGLNHGLTVIDYGDIAGIRIRTKTHRQRSYRGPRCRVNVSRAMYYALTEHHSEWKTYHLIIRTKKHRNMLLTEMYSKDGYKQLLPYLNGRCEGIDIKTDTEKDG